MSIESAMLAKAGSVPFPFQKQWPSHKLGKQTLYHPAKRNRINKLLDTVEMEQTVFMFKEHTSRSSMLECFTMASRKPGHSSE